MASLYHLMHLAAALTEAVGVQEVIDLVADQIVPAFGPKPWPYSQPKRAGSAASPTVDTPPSSWTSSMPSR